MKKGVLGLLLLAFVSSAFAQTQSKRPEAYYHFSMARQLEEQGQWNQAIDEYKKALDLDPNNSGILSEMAQTYLRNTRAREAVDTANKAIAADPNNIDAHRLLRDIYVSTLTGQQPSRENINLAIRELVEIVRLDPTDRVAFLMLGRLYQALNENDKAEEIYKKYLGVEPGSEDGVLALARLHMDSGNNKSAIELLENFLKGEPDADQVLAALGEAYAASNEYAKAANAYKRALTWNPDEIEWKAAYAEALYFNEQFDEAAKVYLELLKADPRNAQALLRMSQVYRRQMKYDQARSTLQQLTKLDPTNVELLFNLYLIDRDEGLLEDALQRLEEILKRTESPNGLYNESQQQNRRMFLTQAALLNSWLGRYDAAVTAFSSLKTISPDKDRVDAYIIDTYRTAKNLNKAGEQLERALKESPGSRHLQILSAELSAEKGRPDDAIKALQKIGGTEPDLQVLAAMSGIYERAKKFDDAINVLNTAAKRFPRESEVYFLQGALHERQKKYGEAEQAFRKALEIEADDPATLNYLGYMLAERGIKLDEALTMTQKAVKSDPVNGAYIDSLGWVYFKLNQLDLAEQNLKRAVRFAPTNATMYEHLGDVYYKLARYQDAAAQWTKGLQFATEDEETDRIRKKLDQAKTRVANRE